MNFAQGIETTRDHFFNVPRIDAAKISAIDFCREYVCCSRPVILLNAVSHWPALTKWQAPDYFLSEKLSREANVILSWTPNGRADAIDEDTFCLPFEERTTLEFAFQSLTGPQGCRGMCGSPYLSSQNDSFRRELPFLEGDIDQVSVGEEALGGTPDAVNYWIAPPTLSHGLHPLPISPVSSTHKDSYENLHTVICGKKTFTLLPPTDAAYLYATREFPVYRYSHDSMSCKGLGKCGHCWTKAPAPEQKGVPWVQVNPDNADLKRFPLFENASPVRVTVEAGETLYLPAFWYHQVSVPTGVDTPTIAVNKWFDANFGVVHCAQQLLLGLSANEIPPLQ